MSSNQSRQPLDPTRRSLESQEFDAALRQKIVGQEEAVRALVDLYQVFCADMCTGTSAVATATNAAQMNANLRRLVMFAWKFRARRIQDLRGLSSTGIRSRLSRGGGR